MIGLVIDELKDEQRIDDSTAFQRRAACYREPICFVFGRAFACKASILYIVDKNNGTCEMGERLKVLKNSFISHYEFAKVL